MKQNFATLLLGFFCLNCSLFAYDIELNASYDYFRGLPDGSWRGNSGAFLAANVATPLYRCVDGQVGGSYGLYNWDGHENVVFKNAKSVGQQAFVTAGVSSSFGNCFTGGLVYDRLFTRHYGVYDLSPSIDQLRFQGDIFSVVKRLVFGEQLI